MRHAGLLLVALVVVALSVLGGASPASAHTSLAESEPANRAVLDAPPSVARLIFAKAVDPETVSAELKRLDGTVVPGLRRTTPNGSDSFVIEFALPSVPDGTYGLPWQAIGPDGHRVAGEVVFGIDVGGDGAVAAEVADASFGSVSGVDRALDASGVLARTVWYVGFALAVGSLGVLWWLIGSPTVAAGRLQTSVRWWCQLGAGLALVGALGRWLVAALVLRRAGIGDGTDAGRAFDSLREASGGAWLVAIVALGIALVALGNLATERARSAVALHAARVAAGAMVVAALGSVWSGHAADDAAPLLGQLNAAVHLVAAAVWVGPLAVLLLGTVDAGWRTAAPKERDAVLTGALRAFSPWAIGAFAVLVLTGVRAIAATTGAALLDSSWGWVVALKVGLVVAVAVPLGAMHHRRVRSAAEARRMVDDEDVATARAAPVVTAGGLGRSVRVEAAVLLLVLGLGATLLSLTPTAALSEEELAALRTPVLDEQLLSGGPVTDLAQCVDLEVGQPNCYREYFATRMRTDGADVAVGEIEALSTTDEFVKLDCHQITHDLGEDAVHHYGSLAEAFTHGGAACWSGYYHGIVETELSELTDEELTATLPTVCTPVADPAYTFDHYNCVHGTGHGVMLRFDGDLFRSLEVCRSFEDTWERASCWGGAYMQNVIGLQSGDPGISKADDLLYPCTGVKEDEVEQCLLMQTSYVLWQNGYDYEGAFALCDSLGDWKASTCYQSMGRDISGNFLLDVDEVISHCDLGAEDQRQWCYAGAVLNAVFNDSGTKSADALCAAVEERWRQFCEENRDGAASTL